LKVPRVSVPQGLEPYRNWLFSLENADSHGVLDLVVALKDKELFESGLMVSPQKVEHVAVSYFRLKIPKGSNRSSLR